jgi:serine O-acetyltransferase
MLSGMRRQSVNPVHQRVRDAHPGFLEAVRTDAVHVAAQRMERKELRNGLDELVQIIRLMCVTDAFAAQVCYRAKAAMQAAGIPVLPRVAHRLAMMLAQVSIGDPVVIQPGFYMPHGQVVIDGITEIHSGVTIRPWVTIGLKEGVLNGPTIKGGARIGTGAKVIGPITIGVKAVIGANAVVVKDVPDGATVAGVPATEL